MELYSLMQVVKNIHDFLIYGKNIEQLLLFFQDLMAHGSKLFNKKQTLSSSFNIEMKSHKPIPQSPET